MPNELPVLPESTETIAELRELYREAEARAARLRLLYATGRDLAGASPETLTKILEMCADRLAFFVGCRSATVEETADGDGFPIYAPGGGGDLVAKIQVDGLSSIDEILDREDRDAFRMQLDMMGTTIDRIRKEREKAVLLNELQEREKRLETLLERIFTAQEEERRRVSHELHDGVAQTATALARMLEKAGADDRGRPLAEDLNADLSHADVARGLVSELRRVIGGLRPTALDDLGLIPALHSLVEGLEADGFKVASKLDPAGMRLSPLVENALYRVAQEAIMNIHKHSGGPCEVIVEANLSPSREERFLRIIDFGNGPSESTRSQNSEIGNNVGIEVMKERMTAIGGTLKWSAGRSKGVVVEARLPKSL